MQHQISDTYAGNASVPMKQAIEACVHCGFCLPTCPTYAEMGDEMNSPRGRIYLMKEALEGSLSPEEIGPYIDNCLGCQACVTACPSGVEYGELISPYREWSEKKRDRSIGERLQRFALLKTIPKPDRFRIASTAARILKPIAETIPGAFGAMIDFAPDKLPESEKLDTYYPATKERRGTVALLVGCAQQALAPRINQAAIRVLNQQGYDVRVPPKQGCCGALAMHTGAAEEARKSAIVNFEAFPDDIDAIISTAAGCGSGMKEYPILFAGSDETLVETARNISSMVKDICEFLDEVGFAPPTQPHKTRRRVAYHDACHLAHAQGIRAAPRKLLNSIGNIELREPAEWEICCGSAGTYNIEHSDTAKALGKRKTSHLLAAEPQIIATGNIGCLTQIGYHLRENDKPLPIVHTVELLDETFDWANI